MADQTPEERYAATFRAWAIGTEKHDAAFTRAIREAASKALEDAATIVRSWCRGDVEHDKPCGECGCCAAASELEARAKKEGDRG